MSNAAETVAPVAPADAPIVPTAAPKAAPVARIASDKPRTREVELTYPVEFDGTLYESITVRRLTAKQVADFVSSLKDNPDARWPLVDAPEAVLEALDDDDAYAIDEVIKGFLPHRFRDAGTPG